MGAVMAAGRWRATVATVVAGGASRGTVLPLLATALAVMVAYYIGARIGSILKFPDTTTSVVWPPNAILTAALLLAPRRQWWVYILAALPAHLFVQLPTLHSLAFVLLIFVTNCSEALFAGTGVRLLNGHPLRLNTLRRVAVFVLAAGLMAPFLSSFLDAGLVATFRGESYWTIWRTRFFSNVLTQLTVVPVVVGLVRSAPSGLRAVSRWRVLEAAALPAGLGLTAFVVLAGGLERAIGIPPSPLIVVVLPFLLWAAVRFGPGVLALALLMTTFIATGAGVHASGRLGLASPAEAVRALQVFLSAIAVPLLCLAGVMRERRRASRALRERLAFEALLSRLSSAFVHVPNQDLGRAFDYWLRRVGQHFRLDRVTLLEFSPPDFTLVRIYGWVRDGVPPGPARIRKREASDAIDRLLEEASIVFPRHDGRPESSLTAHDRVNGWDVLSSVTLPLITGSRVLGALALVTTTSPRRWPHDLVKRLQLLAAVLATALARKETEDALRASESMKSAILDSLTSHVAVVDRAGFTIALSESGSRFPRTRGAVWESGVSVGDSYLEACRHAAADGVPAAKEALAGLESVLHQRRERFSFVYPYRAAGVERWFAMAVVPLDAAGGGAVISYTDISERKRAEMEAEQSRQELAHVSRVSTMGALAASLAHELNQPLAGILANAQAARRFLDGRRPVMDELREILDDIIADDKRAGEVIRRLRDLLQKGEAERLPIDVNSLIRDVVKLVNNDAVIRNVTVRIEPAPISPIVTGDRVQLQQVVLNLLLNALDALAGSVTRERTVVVRTERRDTRTVRVSVEDSGPGLSAEADTWLFQPFHTTKATGMGMGLSISRTIIEAHEGRIGAANNAKGGATFHFVLPLARGSTE